MEKKFGYVKPIRRFSDDRKHPWDFQVPAYRNAPHVWQVGGQDDVSCFLLDTGEGLILIDTGWIESVYLLVDRIWRAGFDPKDIKHIFLTHWHWDHSHGAPHIKGLSGAKIWLSEVDEEWHKMFAEGREPEKAFNPTNEVMSDFEVDYFYDDSKPFEMGRFKIETLLTPGHTPGTTSFFFNDTDDETGVTYRVGLHGGLGTFSMKPQFLEDHNIDQNLGHKFIKQSLEIAEMPIDITLSSHLNQGNIKPNIPQDNTDYSVFVADYLWKDVLLNRVEDVKSFYPESYN